MTTKAFPLMTALLALAALVGCGGMGGAPRVSSPEEWVKIYSRAWLQSDEDRVVAMEMPLPAGKGGPQVDEKGRTGADARRAEVAEEMSRRGFGYLAWSTTRYESAKEHGDHWHVSVSTSGAVSDIVLVKQDGTLLLAPDPSAYP